MKVQVINNKIVKNHLPRVGKLSTGESVINYHLLSEETLAREGWVPLVDKPPLYDSNTQILVPDGYDVGANKVTKLYKIELKPEPVTPLEERLQALESKLSILEAKRLGEKEE